MNAAPASLEALVSVVIPTHNRRRLLRQALDALADQTFDAARLEVVVVADGCEDDTAAMLAEYRPPYSLVVLTRPASGAAAARNAGAAASCGPLLIFLDDDITPTRSFVAAHVAAHARTPGAVVLGPYPPAPHASRDPFRTLIRHWWTAHFEAVAQPGHRFTYRDLLTGNLSLPAQLWRELGGLDPRFRKSREDYEFGVRLLAAGVRFVFAPEAQGWHHEHETMTLKGAFRRAYEEGRMDALMGEKHPAIRPGLPLVQRRRIKRRVADRAVLIFKLLTDLLVRALMLLLPVIGRLGLRRLYTFFFYELRRYWYVRGVGAYFGSPRGWAAYNRQSPPRPKNLKSVTIDLSEGLQLAEARLDELRPDRVRLRFGRHKVGELGFDPDAEPWRGAHLRTQILRNCAPAYLRALCLEGKIVAGSASARKALARSIEHAAGRRARVDPLNIWEEQQAQWSRLAHPPRRGAQRPQRVMRTPSVGLAEPALRRDRVPDARQADELPPALR